MSVFIMFCSLGRTPFQSFLIGFQHFRPFRDVLPIRLWRFVDGLGSVYWECKRIALPRQHLVSHRSSRFRWVNRGMRGEQQFVGCGNNGPRAYSRPNIHVWKISTFYTSPDPIAIHPAFACSAAILRNYSSSSSLDFDTDNIERKLWRKIQGVNWICRHYRQTWTASPKSQRFSLPTEAKLPVG